MTKFLAPIALLWPVLMARAGCEWLWVCITGGAILTVTLFVVLWAVEELRLLASLRLR